MIFFWFLVFYDFFFGFWFFMIFFWFLVFYDFFGFGFWFFYDVDLQHDEDLHRGRRPPLMGGRRPRSTPGYQHSDDQE